jgi:hypothetical protein
MSKVFFDISMFLDGFMTAANQRPEEPMGDGGLKLVDWASVVMSATARCSPTGSPAPVR